LKIINQSYFAQIHDDIFRLDTPVDFIPIIFKHNIVIDIIEGAKKIWKY